jgi:hypothetical protein
MHSDLIYLSTWRWDATGAPTAQLMSRAAHFRTVLFVEAPLEGGWTEPGFALRFAPGGVLVLTPLLPVGMDLRLAAPVLGEMLRSVIDDLGVTRYILWDTGALPTAITAHLEPCAMLHDQDDPLASLLQAPRAFRALSKVARRRSA